MGNYYSPIIEFKCFIFKNLLEYWAFVFLLYLSMYFSEGKI